MFLSVLFLNSFFFAVVWERGAAVLIVATLQLLLRCFARLQICYFFFLYCLTILLGKPTNDNIQHFCCCFRCFNFTFVFAAMEICCAAAATADEINPNAKTWYMMLARKVHFKCFELRIAKLRSLLLLFPFHFLTGFKAVN